MLLKEPAEYAKSCPLLATPTCPATGTEVGVWHNTAVEDSNTAEAARSSENTHASECCTKCSPTTVTSVLESDRPDDGENPRTRSLG